MAENTESQPTKQPAHLTSKQFQEAVLLRLGKLERILDEQQDAQEKLRSELTDQAKRQQEQTEHRIPEIEKTLTQHQQEIKHLLQAKTASSVQQQDKRTLYTGIGTVIFILGVFVIAGILWLKGLQSIAVVVLLALLALIIAGGYIFPGWFPWVGVSEFKKQSTTPGSKKRRSTKSLFDWLGLLIIPFILAGGGFLITIKLHDSDMQIADLQNREAILAAYQSSITDLLLSHKLGSVNLDDQETAHISAISAQSLTLVAIPRLDADQKVILIQFLYNAQLINHGRPVISFKDADLSGIDLSGIDLSGIDLSGANLIKAKLIGSTLNQAYLWNTDLRGAKLTNIHLKGAYLWNAKLGEAHLGGTIQKTDLSNADLSGADLSNADLSNANLRGAHLEGTILNTDSGNVDLGGTNLSYANLSYANLRDAQYDGAFFCHTIPTEIQSTESHKPACPDTASSADSGLEDDVTKWSSSMLTPTMAQRGKPPRLVNNIVKVTAPTYDKNGHALQVFLLGGDPYTTLQAYRSVSFASTTTKFDFSLSFYITEFAISEVPPIQALGFTLSWGKGSEKAILQWQQIGDGTSQQGTPPNWRVGNGTDWQYLKKGKEQVNQELMMGRWYTFDLKGEIMGNMMRFLSFSCVNEFGVANDIATTPLDQIQPFAFYPLQDPMSMNNQLMNIGVQLDGNANEDPYDVYLDGVNFQPK